jgi:hypothetical protein
MPPTTAENDLAVPDASDNSASETGKPTEEGRMYSSGDVRIIVIDDDPTVGRLVQATLAGHDFTIDVVSDWRSWITCSPAWNPRRCSNSFRRRSRKPASSR